ncbi:MAG: glutamate mutase L, partial [Actinomycetes bacterium]
MTASGSDQGSGGQPQRFVVVDFGSTFTKVLEVSADGQLVATGSARTTIESDVMNGLDAALTDAGIEIAEDAKVLACSSAGGGLRIAVVGYERAITAEAGFRVGMSAGGRVCHVTSGELDEDALNGIRDADPDVLLLVGGTDGGNAEVLLHNARAVASADLALPVVLAGNVEVRDQVRRILRRRHIS